MYEDLGDFSQNGSYDMNVSFGDPPYDLNMQLQEFYYLINFYMKRVGFGIGFVGNFLTLLVFYRTRYFRDGPNVYLTAQIFLHFLYILVNLIRLLDEKTGNKASRIHFFCILHTNVLFIFNFLSNWLIAFYAGFSLRRAYRNPPQRPTIAAPSYTSCNCPHLGILVALGCTGMVFYFHLWWMMDGCHFLETWMTFIGNWRRADIYLNSLLPRFLTLIFLPPLYVYYCKARRYHQNSSNLVNGQGQLYQRRANETKIEPLVVALPTFTSIMCLPRELTLFIMEIKQSHLLVMCLGFTDVLLEASFVTKFLLFIAFSPKFRSAIMRCKRCRRASNSDPIVTQTTCFTDGASTMRNSGPTPV